MRPLVRALYALVLALPPPAPLAQGGPPMVSDDPGTPGDGHWEINLAASGGHVPGLASVTAPDADINYGWGERLQLRLDLPWQVASRGGGAAVAGLGMPSLGVKWRFVDGGPDGVAVSTYPQFFSNWAASSPRRGLSDPGRKFYLPLQAAAALGGGWSVDGEVGRGFASAVPDYWATGIILAHECVAGLECMAEVRETLAPHDLQTLVNFGTRTRLAESMNLLAALGRDIGPHANDRQDLSFYLGLQLEL